MKSCVVALVALSVALTIFAGAGQENRSGQIAPEPVVFRILNGAEPPTLDPSLSTDTSSHNILLALFEGLLTYDPETNDGIPGVAGAMESPSQPRASWTPGCAP
jgi:ABC-type oligopeptide transport system substrate-binding subunit